VIQDGHEQTVPALAEPVRPVPARWVALLWLGGYPVLYLLTAVVTLLGGAPVYRIRSVR
jgi:hypothetical protein